MISVNKCFLKITFSKGVSVMNVFIQRLVMSEACSADSQ